MLDGTATGAKAEGSNNEINIPAALVAKRGGKNPTSMYDFETVDLINIENERKTTHPNNFELPIQDQSASTPHKNPHETPVDEERERGSLFDDPKKYIDWIDMKTVGSSEPVAMASRQMPETKTNEVSTAEEGSSVPPKAKKHRKGLRHKHRK